MRSVFAGAAAIAMVGAAPAPPFEVRFEDVTRAAGIVFKHERAASSEKLYLETMGAGGAGSTTTRTASWTRSSRTAAPPALQAGDPAAARPSSQQRRRHLHRRDGQERSAVGPGFFFMGVAVGDYDNDG